MQRCGSRTETFHDREAARRDHKMWRRGRRLHPPPPLLLQQTPANATPLLPPHYRYWPYENDDVPGLQFHYFSLPQLGDGKRWLYLAQVSIGAKPAAYAQLLEQCTVISATLPHLQSDFQQQAGVINVHNEYQHGANDGGRRGLWESARVGVNRVSTTKQLRGWPWDSPPAHFRAIAQRVVHRWVL